MKMLSKCCNDTENMTQFLVKMMAPKCKPKTWFLFLQVVFILLNILKLIVLWLVGKKVQVKKCPFGCRFILFKLAYHVSIVAKKECRTDGFSPHAWEMPRILLSSVMPVMHFGNPMGIQRSHGIPWVAHGLRLLLVNHFVASLWQPVGPVHLISVGGRDVSVKNWHIGIAFETSFICLEVIKSTSVHRCEVFNGWRGKSRSVELEGRDLVPTEKSALPKISLQFALMIRSMECSHSNNPSNTVMQRLCIGA